jgi:hypothetical protein
MRVAALDTTGFEISLAGHPRRNRIGTVLSPGTVLPHLSEARRASLPRPLVAYGLLETAEQAYPCLGLADAVVVRHDLVAAVALRIANAKRG